MAEAYRCEVRDLFVRNPLDPESVWTIWDQLSPSKREQGRALLAVLKDTGTD